MLHIQRVENRFKNTFEVKEEMLQNETMEENTSNALIESSGKELHLQHRPTPLRRISETLLTVTFRTDTTNDIEQ